jgi:integrase
MAIEKLSASKIEALARKLPFTTGDNGEPREARSRLHHDGKGLFFRVVRPVDKDATKPVCGWVLRYRGRDGKTHEMGLGSYPIIDLTTARQMAKEALRQNYQGKDPIQARESERASKRLGEAKCKTFEETAKAYIAEKERDWRDPKSRKTWEASLATYCYPIIGKLPVAEIDTPLVLRVMRQQVADLKGDGPAKPFWYARPQTASKTCGRIETILDWARVNGFRTGDNPARWTGLLEHSLPALSEISEKVPMASLPWQEIPAFMQKLRATEGVAARALEFTILTGARSTGALEIPRSEIDWENAVWNMPRSRQCTKLTQKLHRVPLQARLMEMLRKLPVVHGNERLFIGQGSTGGCAHDAMLKVLGQIRPGFHVHGFRSTFAVWVQENRPADKDLADKALAHVEKDKVKATYFRSDVLDSRRVLMEAWAQWCNGVEPVKLVAMKAA